MPNNKLALYVHLIWATWDRATLITPEVERPLLRCIESEALKHKCEVIALNAALNHVHLLVKIPATISIANLVKQLKGVSSHFANDVCELESSFKWQGSYGAFTVSRWDIDNIAHYIKEQKVHHETGQLMPDLEASHENAD